MVFGGGILGGARKKRGNPYLNSTTVLFDNIHANVGIFSLSYAVMPSFLVSVLFINPYFIFKFIIFNILCKLMIYPFMNEPMVCRSLCSNIRTICFHTMHNTVTCMYNFLHVVKSSVWCIYVHIDYIRKTLL